MLRIAAGVIIMIDTRTELSKDTCAIQKLVIIIIIIEVVKNW